MGVPLPLWVLLLYILSTFSYAESSSCGDTCTESCAFIDSTPFCSGNCYNQCGDQWYGTQLEDWRLSVGNTVPWTPDQFIYYPRLDNAFNTTFVNQYTFDDASSYCSIANGCPCHCTPSAGGCRLCSSGIQDPATGASYWDQYIPSVTRIQTLGGCVDSLFKTALPDFMYANYTLSTADNVIVNCRMRVCNTNGPDASGCIIGDYQCHETVYKQGVCSCQNGNTSNPLLPNWYCTVQQSADALNPSIDQRITNGRQVDVLCVPNWRFLEFSGNPSASGQPSHVCLNTSNSVILSVGPWPSGVYMVVNGHPNKTATHEWGCPFTHSCDQYEPELFYFKECSSTIQNTLFPNGQAPSTPGSYIYEVCEWVPLVDESATTGTNFRDIRQTPNSISPNLISKLYSNPTSIFLGGQSRCHHVSYTTGLTTPVILSDTDNTCVLDSRLQTVVMYPDFSTAALQTFLTQIPTPGHYTNVITPDQFGNMFVPVTTYGDQDVIAPPTVLQPPWFDAFLNTPFQCPSYDTQQTITRVMGYAKLTLVHNFTTPLNMARQWSDPTYLSNFALGGPIRSRFLHSFQNPLSVNHEILQTVRGTGSMFWSRYDPTDCGSCSKTVSVGEQLYYSNRTGSEGCYPLDYFCVPGHCECTQSYFQMPTDTTPGYTCASGSNPSQPAPDQGTESCYPFIYLTDIQCQSDGSVGGIHGVYSPPSSPPFSNPPVGATCQPMRQWFSTTTIGSNTTCRCLPNTGWSGKRCDFCDTQQLVPWFLGTHSTCDITCRSPNNTFIGNAACQNGGSCTYQSPTNTAQCTCPAGYTGTYCQFPRNISLGCFHAKLPFQCTISTQLGILSTAIYNCYLNKQEWTLVDGFDIFAFMSSTEISFSPSGVVDAQGLWQNPIIPISQMCSVLYDVLIGTPVTANPSSPMLGYTCPLPYNTIVSGYTALADVWCQVDNASQTYFYWFDGQLHRYIFSCFSISTPIEQTVSLNTSYAWCHSNPLLVFEVKTLCKVSYPVPPYPSLLSQFSFHQINSLLDVQCDVGSSIGQAILASTSNCFSSACVNGGVCISNASLSDNFTCVCPPLFTGHQCEQLVNKCPPSNPCQHNGTCVPDIQLGLYSCICNNASYGGTNCSSLNECAIHPCLNGGTCIPTFVPTSNYTCNCLPFYGGLQCQVVTDPCSLHPNSCSGQSQCVTTFSSGCQNYTAAANYSGTWGCSVCALAPGLCFPGVCQDVANIITVDAWRCLDQPSYTCSCPFGYFGTTSCILENTELITLDLAPSWGAMPQCTSNMLFGSSVLPCYVNIGDLIFWYSFQYVPIGAQTISAIIDGYIHFQFREVSPVPSGSNFFFFIADGGSPTTIILSNFGTIGPFSGTGMGFGPTSFTFFMSNFQVNIVSTLTVPKSLFLGFDFTTFGAGAIQPYICTGFNEPIVGCPAATNIVITYH